MINTAEQSQQQAEAQSISDQMRKLRQKVREQSAAEQVTKRQEEF